MKKDYQKALKKSTLIFRSNPVPFNGESYQKQKRPGINDQSFLRHETSSEKFLCYILSNQV